MGCLTRISFVITIIRMESGLWITCRIRGTGTVVVMQTQGEGVIRMKTVNKVEEVLSQFSILKHLKCSNNLKLVPSNSAGNP